MNNIRFYSFSLGLIGLLFAGSVSATSIGSDMNIKFAPTSAGMGGVGYAIAQDPVASVFGNPATLTQLDGNTDFTFAANYLNVMNTAENDGSTFLPAFSGDIEAEHYLLPNIAVRQRLTDKLVVGTGLQVISGLGADYRSSNPLSPTVTYLTFGANVAAGYELTPKTSLGVTGTIGYSLLEIGLVSTTGMQESFGFRGGVGITHDLGPVMASLNYNSEMAIDFTDVIQTANDGTTSGDIDLEQPRELILGLATTPAMWRDILIEVDVIYKNWDDADVYKDIWQDTWTFQGGGQYTMNKLQLRAGYSYTTDLDKDADELGNSLGEVTTLNAPGLPPGGSIPISPPVIQFITATIADPFWSHNVTIGAGYDLTETIHADVQAGYAFGRDRTLGANSIEAENFTIGAGVTWKY